MRIQPCLALILAAAIAVAASAQTPSPDEVAAALQKKYDGVRDFSADFTQLYEGGVLRRKAVERGAVLVKKPGRMRWNYKSPEEKVFVSGGRSSSTCQLTSRSWSARCQPTTRPRVPSYSSWERAI
jgi:outer membrane lipoprotein-sorting protein